MSRAKDEAEEVLRQEYTVEYSSQDFVRAVLMAFGALAPAAIRSLDEGASRLLCYPLVWPFPTISSALPVAGRVGGGLH